MKFWKGKYDELVEEKKNILSQKKNYKIKEVFLFIYIKSHCNFYLVLFSDITIF